MKFEELKNIRKEIKEVLETNGYSNMTDVQEKTLTNYNIDLIVQAPTGSGKTLCYTLPIVNMLHMQNISGIKAVVLVPTRELALQITSVFDQFDIKSETFIGGTSDSESIIKEETNVLIGTPGRMWQIVKNNVKAVNGVKWLVLDEADKLLSQGFEGQIQNILGQIPKKKRTTQFYTATVTESVRKLGIQSGNYREVILEEAIPEKLSISYVMASGHRKIDLCVYFMKNNDRMIVFYATCAEVDYFYVFFSETLGQVVYKLHGKMNQKERNEIFLKLKEMENYVLLTTDLSARGFDFKDVDLVIHFDIPKDHANILHRSGRSGRNGRTGKSILFVMENERNYLNYIGLKYTNLIVSECKMDQVALFEEKLEPRKMIELSAKAFVSYMRSYKEHIVNYILNYKELDLEELKALFGLEWIPRMTEFKKRPNYKK
ncbi:SPB4 [Enterospora canceri]|uniref:ATP-dependent RNA helicase n=1 Tax=Enterospora canceri TaxID=1081671 RepID=A0A1Y1S8P9_9MICR|nr:SPB4 [Enterospora canceri]